VVAVGQITGVAVAVLVVIAPMLLVNLPAVAVLLNLLLLVLYQPTTP
jgi:hypothetical protein